MDATKKHIIFVLCYLVFAIIVEIIAANLMK